MDVSDSAIRTSLIKYSINERHERFYSSVPGFGTYKTFSLSLMLWTNTLECWSLRCFYWLVYSLYVTKGANFQVLHSAGRLKTNKLECLSLSFFYCLVNRLGQSGAFHSDSKVIFYGLYDNEYTLIIDIYFYEYFH